MTIFVFLTAFQIAAPVSAVKVINKGTWYVKETEAGGPGKYSWTTYKYTKNHIKVVQKMYKLTSTRYVLVEKRWVIFKKVKKNRLKYVQSYDPRSNSQKGYIKTKYSAVKYYWKYYKPNYLRKPLNAY